MKPHVKFHLVFSFVMGALMISVMTFIITVVNLGMDADFFTHWLRAFVVAYVIGVPAIFFMAPVARKLTGGLLGVAP